MSRPKNENPNDRLEKTARELRKHRPRPSEALVSRVERLAERGIPKRSRSTRIQVSRRKLVFALAATLTVAVVGGIAVGELRQPSNKVVTQGALPTEKSSSPNFGRYKAPSASEDSTSNVIRKSLSSVESGEDDKPSGAGSVGDITTGNRLADLRATLLLKVENRDQLSQRTARAMKIARSLSGYVVAAHVDAPSGGVATSYLELKIPAKRSQEALIEISSLGKILSQEISLEDVQKTVNQQGDQILALRREIASLEKVLEDPSLTAQARSQLQVELAKDRAKLSSLRDTRQQTILRGRLATVTVTFTTGDLKKAVANPSRIHKAINRAWDGLSSEISWAAMGLIVASPFILLAALLALLARTRRRREERRLLEK